MVTLAVDASIVSTVTYASLLEKLIGQIEIQLDRSKEVGEHEAKFLGSAVDLLKVVVGLIKVWLDKETISQIQGEIEKAVLSYPAGIIPKVISDHLFRGLLMGGLEHEFSYSTHTVRAMLGGLKAVLPHLRESLKTASIEPYAYGQNIYTASLIQIEEHLYDQSRLIIVFTAHRNGLTEGEHRVSVPIFSGRESYNLVVQKEGEKYIFGLRILRAGRVIDRTYWETHGVV